jgi:hypothetical protein
VGEPEQRRHSVALGGLALQAGALPVASKVEGQIARAHRDQALKASTRLIARIHDVALALDVARHTDDAAAAAWEARGKLRRSGIRRSIALAARAGRLREGWTVDQVTDALWSLAAPRLYGDLVLECGWSQGRLEKLMVVLAQTFVTPRASRAKKTGARGN